jgi:hypothetical protein
VKIAKIIMRFPEGTLVKPQPLLASMLGPFQSDISSSFIFPPAKFCAANRLLISPIQHLNLRTNLQEVYFCCRLMHTYGQLSIGSNGINAFSIINYTGYGNTTKELGGTQVLYHPVLCTNFCSFNSLPF